MKKGNGRDISTRNVERIDVVCQLLAKYWKKMPDYRLGQLLWAIAGRDPFHIEDYDFIVGLAKRVGEEEPNICSFPEYWVEPNEMRLFISSMINKEKGKCEHCNSENGHWDSKNLWHCLDCDRMTAYYEITEKGKEALRILLED